MVRTGHGPNDWQDEGEGSARTSGRIGGSLVVGARGVNPAVQAVRQWREANPRWRDRDAENAARRIARAAVRAAQREAQS